MDTIIRDGVEVPADVDWATLERRKTLQLGAAKLFIQKMEELGLKYYLAYGCLIGLKRHNGKMIPWDDDVDMVMPRNDYEKAISAMLEDDRFYVLEFTRNPDFRVKPAKVAAKDILEVTETDLKRACYIDIFALDEAPRNGVVKFCKWKLRVLIENVVLARKKVSVGWRRVIGRALGLALPFKTERIHKIMVRLTSMVIFGKRNWTNETLVGEMYGAYGARCLMPWGVYEDNEKACYAEFEGLRVRVPSDVEQYLAHCYGRWQDMPTLEGRRPHHLSDDPWFYSEITRK